MSYEIYCTEHGLQMLPNWLGRCPKCMVANPDPADTAVATKTVTDVVDKYPAVTVYDSVEWPKHYNQGEVECIDAMVSAFGFEAVKTYCRIAAFKYQWRAGHKGNEAEDLRKAIWYSRFSLGDDPRKDGR